MWDGGIFLSPALQPSILLSPPRRFVPAVRLFGRSYTLENKVADDLTTGRVISAAFAQRRKTLANALFFEFPSISKERISEIILDCGFESGVRGEKLSVYDFLRISDKLSDEL